MTNFNKTLLESLDTLDSHILKEATSEEKRDQIKRASEYIENNPDDVYNCLLRGGK